MDTVKADQGRRIAPFDVKRYEGRSAAELRVMSLGALGLVSALSCRGFRRKAARSSETLRLLCHPDPFKGEKIGKGRRRKLAINLRVQRRSTK